MGNGKFDALRKVYQSDLSARAISVYLYLYQRSNKEAACFPAIGTIARELKLSRSTVKRALNELEKEGVVRKERRYRSNGACSSNLYILQ